MRGILVDKTVCALENNSNTAPLIQSAERAKAEGVSLNTLVRIGGRRSWAARCVENNSTTVPCIWVEDAQKHKLLLVVRDEKSGQYTIRLPAAD